MTFTSMKPRAIQPVNMEFDKNGTNSAQKNMMKNVSNNDEDTFAISNNFLNLKSEHLIRRVTIDEEDEENESSLRDSNLRMNRRASERFINYVDDEQTVVYLFHHMAITFSSIERFNI